MQLIILLPIVNTNCAYACNALESLLPVLSQRSSMQYCVWSVTNTECEEISQP